MFDDQPIGVTTAKQRPELRAFCHFSSSIQVSHSFPRLSQLDDSSSTAAKTICRHDNDGLIQPLPVNLV